MIDRDVAEYWRDNYDLTNIVLHFFTTPAA